MKKYKRKKIIAVIDGGKTRQESRRVYEHTFFLYHTLRYALLKKILHLSKVLHYTLLSLKVCISKLSKHNVLLINPHKLDGEKGIPVGIATIASHLQKYNVKTYLLDMNLKKISNSRLLFLIKKIRPEVIGIGSITFQVVEAYRIGRLIKMSFPQIMLVYGGVHPTFLVEEAFEKGKADFVVIGEGENAMLEIFKSLKSRKCDFSRIKGLAYKKKGVVFKNVQYNPIKNLNALPFPAYNKLNPKSYNTDIHIYPHYKKTAVDLMGSRGCPHNCKYCTSPQLYHRIVRLKDAKNIFAEIKYLYKKYGINHFHLHDDNFLIDAQRAMKFCRLLKEDKMQIKWICLTDINTLRKHQSIIPELASVGCIGIELGLESADTKVLKGLNKNQDLTGLLRLNILMKKYGITPMYLFMSFLPGEDLDSVYKTSKMLDTLTGGKCPNLIWFLKSIHSRFGFGMCANPYPGSAFFHTAKKEGVILAKYWEEYRPTRINFIPNSLLADIPVRKVDVKKEEFKSILNRYREEMLYNRRYTVFPENKKIKDYPEFIYDIFELCEGKKNIQEMYYSLKKSQKDLDIRVLCSALRFLAMFGMIGSKKMKRFTDS